jgi:hypothetical protein
MNINSKGQIQPPPDVLITPLLELRNYYAGLAQEYQRRFIEARSQLDHVEALLSNWSYDREQQFSQLEAANKTLVPGDHDSLLFLSSNDNAEFDQETSDLDLLEFPNSEVAELDKQEVDNSQVVPTPKPTPIPNSSLQTPETFVKGSDIPMLAPYEDLTRMEAITQLLDEYKGTVCHIDFIVRSLYGELEPSLFRIVKGRVQSSLTQGRERGYWSAVPNEPGCYTLDLRALSPNSNNRGSHKSIKSKRSFVPPKNRVIPMLEQYEGQFLIDAITSLLEEYQGRVFSVNEVVSAIYGELNSEEFREVKNKVLNELSRGHRTGRFSRVPDQIGFYTWDVKKILKRGYR